ncbi:hypothetical protein [Leifsonia sp. Leaf264]|uniref:hypothetical protein n=1 Tax=Leifsonia sp. Leaf264 TaxID=1736314 RepID=UPI0006F559A0|nr:hypothetical protein [Leifsonia sp. Leaf264]KQO98752.1 hypothetical protein ASF30_11870 [Leifsonia sp. Leaf264]
MTAGETKELTKRQLVDINLLARMSVHGVQYAGEVFWPSGEGRRWPAVATKRLIDAGWLTIANKYLNYAVTDAGMDLIEKYAADVRRREQIVAEVSAAHWLDYTTYSRGSSPIRGWGATSRGCRVTCSCGLDARYNGGRADAKDAGKLHKWSALNTALAAAGFDELPMPD